MENENLQFDEKLSDAVREYPCLYDKTKNDYKDVNVNRNTQHGKKFFIFKNGHFILTINNIY